MEITLTTPALLFPAVSLLMLAYTNRFLALSALIRALHARYQMDPGELLIGQIANLRRRVRLIRDMQAVGVFSLFTCVLCMFVLFAGQLLLGKLLFAVSLLLLLWSFWLSVVEIRISVQALDLHLRDLEQPGRQ